MKERKPKVGQVTLPFGWVPRLSIQGRALPDDKGILSFPRRSVGTINKGISAGLFIISTAILLSAVFLPFNAFALGTASGTDILNTATVDYEMYGTGQTQITASAVLAVDNKVNLTVERVGGYVTVAPGSTRQVLQFTITNTGNTAQDYSLTARHGNNEIVPAELDNFNATDVNVFVENDANPGYQAGEDTAISINNLAADDGTNTVFATVYVVSNIPAGRVTGDISAITLIAITRNANGTVINETAGANTAGVDVVFADGAGDTDAPRDKKHSDTHSYKVEAGAVTIVKAGAVSGTAGAISGATIVYTLTVTVSSDVTGLVITDLIPVNTTYTPGTLKLDSVILTDVSGDDAGDVGAAPPPGVITVNLGDVTAGVLPKIMVITFEVKIND